MGANVVNTVIQFLSQLTANFLTTQLYLFIRSMFTYLRSWKGTRKNWIESLPATSPEMAENEGGYSKSVKSSSEKDLFWISFISTKS